MKKIILTILLTLIVCFYTQGQYGRYFEKYFKPSKATVQNAKTSTKDWLSKYATMLGIPRHLRLGKLEYRPSEGTFSDFDKLIDTNKTPTDSAIQEALRKGEKYDIYDFNIKYKNKQTGKQQTIYFDFDYFGQLLNGIMIFEFNGISNQRQSYSLDGKLLTTN
jgi:hypothetical protein